MGKGKHAGSRAARLSAKQGRALVEQWQRSGQSVSEYCRAHDVREHVLRYRLSRETTRNTQAAAAQSEFFVVSTPASAAAAAPANDGHRAGGAVIVMLPAVTPAELVQMVRGLLEGRA